MTRCNFCGDLFIKKQHNSSIFGQLVCPKCAKEIFKSNMTIGLGILHYRESDDILLRALKSIDNQKGFNFDVLDVIVVTDGNGYDINEEYITSKLNNIKPKFIYREKNVKVGGVRNYIIKALDTDYIMFMDCDDMLHSNKVLKRIYNKVSKYKPEIYCSAVFEEQYNGTFKKYTNLMCLNMCHGKAFKRSALLKYDVWFNEGIVIGEDLVWLVALYDVCDSIYYDSNFVSYRWLFNKDSITRNTGVDVKIDSYYRCFDPVMQELNDWYANLDKNKFVNEKFITMMYNIFYYRILLSTSGKQQEEYLKRFFDFVVYSVDFNLTDRLDKTLNRHLLRKLPTFRESYRKYKNI